MIDSNAIERIEESSLNSLKNLEHVYFPNNLCINQSAQNSQEISLLKENLKNKCGNSKK